MALNHPYYRHITAIGPSVRSYLRHNHQHTIGIMATVGTTGRRGDRRHFKHARNVRAMADALVAWDTVMARITSAAPGADTSASPHLIAA